MLKGTGHRFGGKDLRGISSRHPHTMSDVSRGFGERKRMGSVSQRDSLAKPPQFRPCQLFFDFRLAGKDDLQQLVAGSFHVRKQSNLFQDLLGQVVGLVHDEDRCLQNALAFQEPLVEDSHHPGFFAGVVCDAEITEHIIEKFCGVQLRIKHKCRGR